MKRTFILLSLLVVVIGLSGCTTGKPINPPPGEEPPPNMMENIPGVDAPGDGNQMEGDEAPSTSDGPAEGINEPGEDEMAPTNYYESNDHDKDGIPDDQDNDDDNDGIPDDKDDNPTNNAVCAPSSDGGFGSTTCTPSTFMATNCANALEGDRCSECRNWQGQDTVWYGKCHIYNR